MYNFEEAIKRFKGHLEIMKVDKNNVEEVIFDDHNIIVSGFGVDLAHLFSLSGSTRITDYQIDRFQLGISGSTALEVSSTYSLSSTLSSIAEYTGTAGNLLVVSSNQIKNGSVVTSPTAYFAKIPFNKVTRIDDITVRYTLVIDYDSCNSLTRNGSTVYLNEVGLFAKNPRGISPDASILVAYRSFPNINKTSDIALVFRWSISF